MSIKEKMSSEQKNLLFLYGIVFFGNYFSRVFVNTYLYGSQRDMNSVIIYNILQYGFIIPAAIAIYRIKSKFNLSTMIRSGIITFAVFYLLILLLKGQIYQFLIPVSCLLGIGNALFFIAYNGISTIVISKNHTERFLSIQMITSMLGTLIPPLISGYIIKLNGGSGGYHFIFAFSSVCYVAAFIFARKLAKYDVGEMESLKTLFLNMVQNKKVLYAEMAELFKYQREGVLNLIMTVVIFAGLRDESIVGNFNFMCSASAIIITYLVGKYAKLTDKNTCMMISVGGIIIGTLLLVFMNNIIYFFVIGVSVHIFSTVYSLSSQTVLYHSLRTLKDNQKNHFGYSCIREIIMDSGRVMAIWIIFMIPHTKIMLCLLLSFFAVTQIISFYFYQKSLHTIK